jgi:hypothetical protein
MMPIFVNRNLSEGHPARNDKYILPDTVTTMLRTRKGVLVNIRLDWCSPSPRTHNWYSLQGTKASFISHIDASQESQIWIEGRSPQDKNNGAKSWESLWKYADEFEHPWWKEAGADVAQAGHGGSDFFVLREFVNAIIEEREPMINVHDAVTWSSITPLSRISIDGGNQSVEVPQF